MKQNFIFKTTKFLTFTMLILLSFSLVFGKSTIDASAHNAYFLAIAIDDGSFRYIPTVMYEENDWLANSHSESDVGDFTTELVDQNGVTKDFAVPEINYDTSNGQNEMSEADIKKEYDVLVKTGDGDKALVFTFPGLHGRGFRVERKHASGVDEEIATFVAEYLVGDLNDSLSWMMGKAGGYKKFNTDEMKKFSAGFSNNAVKTVTGGGNTSVTLGGQTFTISKASASDCKPVEGKTTADDYVVITHSGGDKKVALAKINKGYQSRTDISDAYKKALKEYKDPDFLNWKFIVLQGNYNSDISNITFSSINELIKPTMLESMITELLSSLLRTLRSLLGLYPINEVLLNAGSRDLSHFYGIMPKGWMNSATLLNVICTTIGLGVLGFSLVRMLFKRQLSTIGIGERITLMEGFKDIILTAFLLLGFSAVFSIMVRINYSLVNVFEQSSYFSQTFGTTGNMTAGILGAVIINIAFFIITAYFNVMYVLRGFTVAMLYGLAPLAIISISFGGKYKSIFSNFSKELIANIFLQTFHAMCVAFFTSVTSTNQLRTFELLTILMAFIPLTNLVRQSILGLPGGVLDQAGGITSMGAGLVGGAVGSMIGKGGGGGSGGGSGGGGSSGIGVNNEISSALNNRSSNSGGKLAKTYNKAKGNPVKSGESFGSTTNGSESSISDGNFKRVDKARGLGNATLNKTKQIGKGVASGLYHAGTAVGYASVGDKRMTDKHTSSMGGSGSRGGGGASSSYSNPNLRDIGAKELYTDADSSMLVMNDTNGSFNRKSLKGTSAEKNFSAMRDCFLGQGDYGSGGSMESHRNDALDYYKSRGIEGIGRNNKGNTTIKFNNDVADNPRFDMKDIANMSMYDPDKS